MREVKDQLSIFNQLGANDPSKWAKKGKHALVGGLIGGLLGVLMCGRTGVLCWLIFGLLFGLVFGLCGGGLFCLKHLVLRLVLWMTRSAPVNYVRFLDHAVERLFLRKVGGGYIFIHRMLLEYFALLAERHRRDQDAVRLPK